MRTFKEQKSTGREANATVSLCTQPENTNQDAPVHVQELGLEIPTTVLDKEVRLRTLFRELGAVVVAYSGGVDSSYVAYVANSELGPNALCVTGVSASLPAYLSGEVDRVVNEFGFRHEKIQTDELDNPNYQANLGNRCYFCKDELYTKLTELAQSRGIEFIVDGSTTDDLDDYRPGRQAAREHLVRSPLIEVGMSKAEVRELSRQVALPTWDKPASPCLSSRIAYGTTVTIERLKKVDRGEDILREFGFREFRVRHHDTLVRLEIAPAELERVLNKDIIDQLALRFRELGFKYVTLDLQGFRSGSMNEALPQVNL
ncbi:MAG TPA: ATP-dependent sacrificial sulfur transferase LarE [Pyrinomonadaceae bacterium]